MKILCKKNYCEMEPLTRKRWYFKVDVTYEAYEWDHRLMHVKDHTGFGIILGMWSNAFLDHFYSPEETQNIKRTELIDKILL